MEIKSYKKKNGETSYGFIVYVGKENGKVSTLAKKGLLQKQKQGQHYSNFKKILKMENRVGKKSRLRKSQKNGSKITLKLSKKVPTSRLLGISRITSIQFLAIGK